MAFFPEALVRDKNIRPCLVFRGQHVSRGFVHRQQLQPKNRARSLRHHAVKKTVAQRFSRRHACQNQHGLCSTFRPSQLPVMPQHDHNIALLRMVMPKEFGFFTRTRFFTSLAGASEHHAISGNIPEK